MRACLCEWSLVSALSEPLLSLCHALYIVTPSGREEGGIGGCLGDVLLILSPLQIAVIRAAKERGLPVTCEVSDSPTEPAVT